MATDIFITPASGTVDFNNGIAGSVLGTIATMKVYDSLTTGNLSIQNATSGVRFLNRANPGNVFEAYGTYGNLFTISDDLTDSIFSVNNSAGLPVFDVYSNNSVYAGQYASGDFAISGNKVGIGTRSPASKLQVNGSLIAGGVDNGSVIFYRSTNPATIGSTDAVLYVSDRSNSDWGITIDKTGFNYGLKIIVSASSPESFVINNGSTNPISFNGNGTFSGTVTAASFAGALTGNVTGNASGSSGTCTGNAASATVLATARTIGGVSFDGSAAINLPGVNTAGNQNTSGSSASCTGNAATATNLSTVRTNWSTNGTISAVVGQLAWKNYGNNHTIFDASASTSPNGGAVNNTNPDVVWGGTYPTLMGWNGANTYGVRVDSCRLADNAGNITAYTINQSVGTGSTPSFLTVRGRNVFGERVAVTSAASTAIDTQYNVTQLTLAATTTLSFTNVQSTDIAHMWTIVTLGNGGVYSINWPGAIKWPGATAPTVTTTSGKRDIYQFITYDGGTNIYAIIVGQNL